MLTIHNIFENTSIARFIVRDHNDYCVATLIVKIPNCILISRWRVDSAMSWSAMFCTQSFPRPCTYPVQCKQLAQSSQGTPCCENGHGSTSGITEVSPISIWKHPMVQDRCAKGENALWELVLTIFWPLMLPLLNLVVPIGFQWWGFTKTNMAI